MLFQHVLTSWESRMNENRHAVDGLRTWITSPGGHWDASQMAEHATTMVFWTWIVVFSGFRQFYLYVNRLTHGRTDRRTNGHTDGHTLLKRCEVASKKKIEWFEKTGAHVKQTSLRTDRLENRDRIPKVKTPPKCGQNVADVKRAMYVFRACYL